MSTSASSNAHRFVRAAIEGGKLYAAIAAEFDLSLEGVRYVARKYALRSPRYAHEGDEADIVGQFKRGVPLAQIQSRLSAPTVRRILTRAGLHTPKPPAPRKPGFWTDARIATLKCRWGKERCGVLARRLGTTKHAVIGKADRLGLERLQPPRNIRRTAR